MADTQRPRARRRDGIENRERILDLAETLFDSEGLDVGFNRIAAELGVGVGTVYRHFPDRDALLWGVYERYQTRVDEGGAQVLAEPPGLPRVVAFLDGAVAFSLRWPLARALKNRVQRAFPERIAPTSWAGEIVAAVELAKSEGELRPDLEAGDVAVLARMLVTVAEAPEPERSLMLPRMRAYALDSLRPVGSPRPALPSEPLTLERLTTLVHRWTAMT